MLYMPLLGLVSFFGGENEGGLVLFNLTLKIIFAKNLPLKVYGNLKPIHSGLRTENLKTIYRSPQHIPLHSLQSVSYINQRGDRKN